MDSRALALSRTAKRVWGEYPNQDHVVWRELFRRQHQSQLKDRVAPEFLTGLHDLGINGQNIPDFSAVNATLKNGTGWELVPVPKTIKSVELFKLLAQRQFPAISTIRPYEQIDYALAPDLWHDVFGHVPMLMIPSFARYLEAFGHQGLMSMKMVKAKHFARVFFYIVEFGLVRHGNGIKFFGAAIASSLNEQRHCFEDVRTRKLRFDLKRVMRTKTRYEGLQPTYFVIDNFSQIESIITRDLSGILEEVSALPDLEPDEVVPGDIPVL